MRMHISTLDPVSMKYVQNVETAPYLIEGCGRDALKIYFECEAHCLAYLDIPLHATSATRSAMYARFADRYTGRLN